MAVSIRLNRKGTKDRPYYKIVAVDSRKRRDGRFIEQLGTYDPLLEGTNFTIDLAIADKWLAVGAKPSETVNSMIRKARTAAAAATA
jgi:small subunit ribosomal protein S16